ncbi:LysR family transcriptional regulator [Rhodophyticola sp. CCM32]|uniref:LysR substrate-binding domain-containing protein n=1 Tax=Rhodophyticola sp. CCM32 TaxID=2916397 RepID=UPI00107F9F34|nr:LysR substrate-binding domain-containing protein [Rhodophyticola sp. CCM32]QBY02542.1 LysR family transcriptional regulator [Rhodophyticola sp. CCM32]
MRDLNAVNLTALRAVEAVARLGSLRAAADELGVTSGAVSQQVIKAENQLDRKLFIRTPTGLVPTDVGREASDHLAEGFAALARGVASIQRRSSDAITISVAPVFAGKWLVWRMGRFAEAHEGLRIRIDASVDLVEPHAGEIDACIRVGWGDWTGVDAEELYPQRVFPVCSPSMADKLKKPSDLANVPIIREPKSMFGWDVWLKPNDMTEDDLAEGPVFSDASLCLDASVAGQGVFLAWETLAADALQAGRLVEPFPGRFRTGISYWFVEPKGQRRSRTVEAFRAWLVSELRTGEQCGISPGY